MALPRRCASGGSGRASDSASGSGARQRPLWSQQWCGASAGVRATGERLGAIACATASATRLISRPPARQPATPDVTACIEANADSAKTVINKAISANIAITQTAAAREKLLQEYYKP